MPLLRTALTLAVIKFCHFSLNTFNKFPEAMEYFNNTVCTSFSLHNSVANEILSTMNKK